VNVDYSVCNALNFNSHGLRESLLIYDVYCQYGVHFKERLQENSQYLSTDPEMEIFGAIGKFHLADHVDSCFSKWSLNFMKGAGHIDGEIMETLWSGMNKVSAAARSMSKAHRHETLDDYMRDSNWKKIVGIGKFFFSQYQFLLIYYFFSVSTLITKLKRSQVGIASTEPAFQQLDESCVLRNLPVEAWRFSEHLAMEERGEHLAIFDINHQKAQTLAQITLELTNRNDTSNNMVNIVDWIADGIKAENDQFVFYLTLELIFF
jgi:Kyakuja-Dileera-Zisupton transposase